MNKEIFGQGKCSVCGAEISITEKGICKICVANKLLTKEINKQHSSNELNELGE